MKSFQGLILSSVVLFGLTLSAYAQPAKQPVPVRVSVAEITDNRTTGSFHSECKVELKFTGDAAADASSVRQVRVKKAVDELGRDLMLKEKDSTSSSNFDNQRSGALKADLKLRNPSRNASTIKIIEGEVELFAPTEANGGILILKDILKNPGEPVKNPELQKYGIELVYLTKAAYETKKKEFEEQKKNTPGAALGEAMGDLFKGMFSGMMPSESTNAVRLYVKDPNKKIVEMELQDSSGKELKRRGSWSSSGMHNYDLDAAPPADTRLVVYLATPEATRSFPFKLEEIPLP